MVADAPTVDWAQKCHSVVLWDPVGSKYFGINIPAVQPSVPNTFMAGRSNITSRD